MKIREDRTIWTASMLMNRRQAIKRTALLSGGMALLKHSLLGQASSLSIQTSAAFGPKEESLFQIVVDMLIPATDTPGQKSWALIALYY